MPAFVPTEEGLPADGTSRPAPPRRTTGTVSYPHGAWRLVRNEVTDSENAAKNTT